MTSTWQRTWNILHDDKSRFFLRYRKSISDKYWDLFFNIAHVFENFYILGIYNHFATQVDSSEICQKISTSDYPA